MWDDTYNPAEDRRQAWRRLRHKAIALLEAGHKPVIVAAALSVTASTVRDWRMRHRRGGWDALVVGKPPGRKLGSTFTRTRGKGKHYGQPPGRLYASDELE